MDDYDRHLHHHPIRPDLVCACISREDELKILQHKHENNMIKLVHNWKEDKAKRLSKEPKTK